MPTIYFSVLVMLGTEIEISGCMKYAGKEQESYMYTSNFFIQKQRNMILHNLIGMENVD